MAPLLSCTSRRRSLTSPRMETRITWRSSPSLVRFPSRRPCEACGQRRFPRLPRRSWIAADTSRPRRPARWSRSSSCFTRARAAACPSSRPPATSSTSTTSGAPLRRGSAAPSPRGSAGAAGAGAGPKARSPSPLQGRATAAIDGSWPPAPTAPPCRRVAGRLISSLGLPPRASTTTPRPCTRTTWSPRPPARRSFSGLVARRISWRRSPSTARCSGCSAENSERTRSGVTSWPLRSQASSCA
mmetsp:Transcript_9885/g.28112  ORF Transcript_9885/g.28112 Transcript_9885/m.28112 type:complete len:243 (-) Transcript_9885:2001-2729(-)